MTPRQYFWLFERLRKERELAGQWPIYMICRVGNMLGIEGLNFADEHRSIFGDSVEVSPEKQLTQVPKDDPSKRPFYDNPNAQKGLMLHQQKKGIKHPSGIHEGKVYRFEDRIKELEAEK